MHGIFFSCFCQFWFNVVLAGSDLTTRTEKEEVKGQDEAGQVVFASDHTVHSDFSDEKYDHRPFMSGSGHPVLAILLYSSALKNHQS
jgi:hypothetical protein